MDGISTPQILNFKGYIKKKKVMVLICYVSTHNLIHCKLAKVLHFFINTEPEFQVMTTDGGNINFSWKFHKINLNMREYVLNSPMTSIPMGGVDVVLGVQYL